MNGPEPRCFARPKPQPHVDRRPEWVNVIVAQVARKHRINPRDINGRSRFLAYAEARIEAMRRVKAADEKLSYPTIGSWFDRHHTTVMSACGVLKGKGKGGRRK